MMTVGMWLRRLHRDRALGLNESARLIVTGRPIDPAAYTRQPYVGAVLSAARKAAVE